MRDGKALQMGTSHELGQRFSRAFNIGYRSAEGATELCWTTSWGSSTRMLGGLIMCHGDDFGLVLPPAVAPVQAVVVVAKDTDGEVARTASALVDELTAAAACGRARRRRRQGFGWRATEWDLQGVPVRVEIGPRDVAEKPPSVYRRDTREKVTVRLDAVVDEVRRLIAAYRPTCWTRRRRDASAHLRLHDARCGARGRRRPASPGCRGARSASREKRVSPRPA